LKADADKVAWSVLLPKAELKMKEMALLPSLFSAW
jgi:hypothetical protein